MNPITTNTTAAEINKLHALATQRAGEAIEHATAAGKLLLQAKASMPYGQFTAWLSSNIAISPRQCQRYMQVAQGKPLPIRAPVKKAEEPSHVSAVDTRPTSKHEADMADLPNTDLLPVKQGFAAIADHVMMTSHNGRHIFVEQSTTAGYFFVSCVALSGDDDAVMDYLTKPIRGDYVDAPMKAWGIADPASLDWRSAPMTRPVKAALELVQEAA